MILTDIDRHKSDMTQSCASSTASKTVNQDKRIGNQVSSDYERIDTMTTDPYSKAS